MRSVGLRWCGLARVVALAVGGREHTVVSDDAIVSLSPGWGLGGGDDAGGAGAEQVAAAVKTS